MKGAGKHIERLHLLYAMKQGLVGLIYTMPFIMPKELWMSYLPKDFSGSIMVISGNLVVSNVV